MEPTEKIVTTTDSTNNDGKTIAIISYLTIIGFVVALVMNSSKKHPFASYHIRQMLGLTLTGLAVGMVGIIPVLGWIINLVAVFVLFYMWIMGLISALNGHEKPLPFLGEKYGEWFKNL